MVHIFLSSILVISMYLKRKHIEKNHSQIKLIPKRNKSQDYEGPQIR